jgi:4-diphosphocytidyl-2-C-methyl-D-erythritol kinase
MPERTAGQPRSLRLFAPAKLNLGLEVLGRRPDGYHEVTTILRAVSVFDILDLSEAGEPKLEVDGTPVDGDNLILQTLTALDRAVDPWRLNALRLSKRIPVAAGLGGGSSDAGTLVGAAVAMNLVDRSAGLEIAALLGSDVPFFLRGGLALATGTGTTLESLPESHRRWYVVVAPNVEIPDKTRTLYQELEATDFSDGERTRAQARRLRAGSGVDPVLLVNSFSRALLEREPVALAIGALRDAGAPNPIPTGAGLAVFTVCQTYQQAASLARRLPPERGRVLVCTDARADLNLSRLPLKSD